ncbi:hypothetical protein BDP27DRAFT_1317905 [Rhodocollybia butyracea]|uniref:MYND-type domain-containing protein n=1 Tax=Rhodocollybia butyracea TaxID=206335 RepID=A0A9P5UCE0_9AGAR|nr:hypothetical protein BDP27DRAFT_1317905 [Rhodocollybia butyracea]
MTSHRNDIIDLYNIALLLNYERAASEPRFRHSKLREVTEDESQFQTVRILYRVRQTDYKGPKDAFLFERRPPVGSEDTDKPDLPSNMLRQPMSQLTSNLTPDRLETIYWQARGHDGCFASACIFQYFFDLFPNSEPSIRIRLADGKEYTTSAESVILEIDLTSLKHRTCSTVLPQNESYVTGAGDQPIFRHAVIGFGTSREGNIETVLDMSSMQFGDVGRGPGRKGKGTFVLESLDSYLDRLEFIAAGHKVVKTSVRVLPHHDQAQDLWQRDVAKRAKERWEKRKDHHWCGHCGHPLDNSQLKRCSGCQEAYYCDKEHQTKAWSSHHKRWCGKS